MSAYDIEQDLKRITRESVQAINAADSAANDMARLAKGRLRHVDNSHLKDLKKELRDYNMHTGEWKPLGGNHD